MLKNPHPVPEEVQEWLDMLDEESLLQVARDAVAYVSQVLDKEPNAVVLEILASINDDPREFPKRRLPTFDEELAEQNRQFKASGKMQDKWKVFQSFPTGELRTVQMVADEVITRASDRTQQIWRELATAKHGEIEYEVDATSREHALFYAGHSTGYHTGFEASEASEASEESIDSYGVFLSNDGVRVRKVRSAAELASLTEADRETYDNDFTIAYYPGEFSGRIVEATSRDLAIYTAGLLDGVDQVEARLPAVGFDSGDLDEDLCASGHTV